MLNWSPPQEPNGVIIAYEVSYRSNQQSRITRNTTIIGSTIFTTPELLPNTNVSGISVRAYTKVGPGPATVQPFVVIPREPVPRE